MDIKRLCRHWQFSSLATEWQAGLWPGGGDVLKAILQPFLTQMPLPGF
jgi:hypothetical protein